MIVHTYIETSPTLLQYHRTFASLDMANAHMEACDVANDWHNFVRMDDDVSPPPYITRDD